MIGVKRINYWIIGLLVLIAVHLYLLSRLIFFPYPELFIYSYLTDKGLLPYKQILDQHFPGLMLSPVNLYNLGMKTPQVARVWHFSLIALTHIILFLVAKKIFKSTKWALLVSFLYLIWQPFFEGYVLWIETFVSIFLLASLYLLFSWLKGKNSKLLFWTGLFLGIALLFKQVILPLMIIVGLYLYFENNKYQNLKFYSLGFIIPVFILIVYIFLLGVFKDFFYWTVTFNLTTFSAMGRKYPTIAELIKSFPLFGAGILSWIYIFFKTKNKSVLIIGLFLFGGLAFTYARFDFVHLQPALPFAVLLTVLLFKNINKKFLVSIMSAYLFVVCYLLLPFYRTYQGKQVLFFGDFERKLSKSVLESVKPGDKIFVLGSTPHLYQLTNTLPSGNIFVFQFPWFMIKAEDRVLSGIISDPPKVVVKDKNMIIQGISVISYMQKIDHYIEDNYKTTKIIDGVEIMIPR